MFIIMNGCSFLILKLIVVCRLLNIHCLKAAVTAAEEHQIIYSLIHCVMKGSNSINVNEQMIYYVFDLFCVMRPRGAETVH